MKQGFCRCDRLNCPCAWRAKMQPVDTVTRTIDPIDPQSPFGRALTARGVPFPTTESVVRCARCAKEHV